MHQERRAAVAARHIKEKTTFMTVSKVVSLAALLALSTAVLAQSPRRDGRWEVTMQMEMPGMPGGMPPFTSETCVTKEQADDPQRAVPQQPGRGGQSDCKTEDYKMTGNKVTWAMKCTTPQPMTGTGEMVYTDNAYTGVMKMTGKRLGDCTK